MFFGTSCFTTEYDGGGSNASSATIASVEAAFSAEPGLDSSSIAINMLGRTIQLEGYINDYKDREKAIAIAALIAGPENVRDRMLSRRPS